jgi:hypothetical protein
MSKSLTYALILAVSISSVSVAATASEQSATEAPAKKKKPKKICKSSSQDTGSRITKRVCKTQEEWEAGEDGQEVGIKSKGGAATTG